MPPLPPVHTRTIEVGQDFLPAPATRLVVTQYLETSQDPLYWALIVVGAFFDDEDRIVWSSEVFVGHLDVQLESDDSSEGSEEASWTTEQFVRTPSPAPSLRLERDARDIGGEAASITSAGLSGTPPIAQPRFPQASHGPASFQPAEIPPTPLFWPAPVRYIEPPTSWDPTRQGPVPGHWQASYDYAADRWVHTWQPFPLDSSTDRAPGRRFL
ncbi:hypothetical protein JDV02_003911 [Purpureocillium takamizusanense]|uniref:Uncharacterized protein n=1 Tax=Purpureocillium takamizusanense TaxID=2060973 RepID=A0A9Q8QEP6_9HYPO|nr:uncharacterized protein JDV02_003911 [Purpureocillium takamizusanense]UNI17579.1 hypothetical protein JDV02_003911 [Purpureocillium takamizusanense]